MITHDAGDTAGDAYDAGMSTTDRLIYMANQIATFFETMPDGEGVDGVAEHINSFWEPRMRRQFFTLIETAPERFRPLVIEASALIRRPE